MSRIIIGDVHGCFKTLQALIAKLPKDIPITFTGDLIDRGKDSRAVVDFVKNGKYDCVIGNHEIMMCNDIKFIQDIDCKELGVVDYYNGQWIRNGGENTIANYTLEDGSYVLQALKDHIDWFKGLPYHILYENEIDDNFQTLLVSHSTAAHVWNIYDHNSDEFKDRIVWGRYPMPPKIESVYNIYGHTPQGDKATIKKHFACIDTGCCYDLVIYGKLTALQFPEMVVYEQENVEEDNES